MELDIPYKMFERELLTWLADDIKIELTQEEFNLAALEAQQADVQRRR